MSTSPADDWDSHRPASVILDCTILLDVTWSRIVYADHVLLFNLKLMCEMSTKGFHRAENPCPIGTSEMNHDLVSQFHIQSWVESVTHNNLMLIGTAIKDRQLRPTAHLTRDHNPSKCEQEGLNHCAVQVRYKRQISPRRRSVYTILRP